jgi:hypothetical protein
VAAICGRDSTSTSLNLFFLSHGWHQDLFKDFIDKLLAQDAGDSPIKKANRILQKLKELREWAQAAMAMAQEAQEKAVNRGRVQASIYHVGDKV